VATRPFVDYYEILQLSPRATMETVERVYRLLAKRYHPDNQQSGDSDKFHVVHEAFEVLSDPERRAAYDVKYDAEQDVQWKIFDQKSAEDGREEDRRILHGILSVLYVERRRNPESGGLGAITLERALAVPEAHLRFPIWYMKQQGWLEMLDNGLLAITVNGIDKLLDKDLALREDRLLAEQSMSRPERRAEIFPGPRAVDRVPLAAS
jgi:curved DNA-binding protein CbpA